MSKHTPGPWLRDGMTVYALMHAGWRRGVEMFKNRFSALVQYDRECSKEEAEANARLIAAAPDLLAVLQELQECAYYWTDYDVPIGIQGRIDAAITKAVGDE